MDSAKAKCVYYKYSLRLTNPPELVVKEMAIGIKNTADTPAAIIPFNITFINFWHIFFISFTSFRTIPMEYKNKKIEIIYPK